MFHQRSIIKIYTYTDVISPSSIKCFDTSDWVRYFPDIDYGDVIFLEKSGQFIKIRCQKDENYFVCHTTEYKQEMNERIFPIDYWQEFGKNYTYRLWIHVNVFYESFLEWIKNPKIRTIGEINVSDNNMIQLSITYDKDIIYIYHISPT